VAGLGAWTSWSYLLILQRHCGGRCEEDTQPEGCVGVLTRAQHAINPGGGTFFDSQSFGAGSRKSSKL